MFVLVVGFVGRCWCECRRHDTPAKPRVARVPKARTEPWVNTYTKDKSSVGAALSARAFGLFAVSDFAFVGKVPPLWGSINVFQ